MNKEKWINEVMSSLDDMKSAEANPFLYNKIISRIGSGETEIAPVKLVWLSAASLALLVLLNFSILNSSARSKNNSASLEKLANSYNLINENTLYYNQ